MPSLGNDLAIIRKHQDLSLSDIHDATKIPVPILESIEDDSIFISHSENKTYVRSYVRSYAKALKIKDKYTVQALNQLQAGTYSGLLTQKMGIQVQSTFEFDHPEENAAAQDKPVSEAEDSESDAAKPETETSDPEEAASGLEERNTKERKPNVGKSEKTASGSKNASDKIASESEDASDSENKKKDNKKKKAEKESAKKKPRPAIPQGPKPPNVNSVDWVDVGRKFRPLEKKSRVWMGIIVFVLLICCILLYIFYPSDTQNESNSGQTDNTETTDPTATPDSLQLNLNTSPADSPSQAGNSLQSQSQELSDTLSIIIYGAYGKLEPVRVFTDVMDSLNPYWIDEGEALQFDFVNTLRIRGSYSRMVLIFNGHVIENFQQRFYNEETRTVEINRQIFEDDPKWLQPPPDSLAIDAPQPSNVKQSPTLN